MRKPFSMALCGLAVAIAGSVFAAGESKPLMAWSETIGVHVEHAVQLFGPLPRQDIKTQRGGFEPVSIRTAAPKLQDSGTGSKQAMLLAGLTIIGVIIKRRYGKGN